MDIKTVITLENDEERNMLHTMLRDADNRREEQNCEWEDKWHDFWNKLMQVSKPHYTIPVTTDQSKDKEILWTGDNWSEVYDFIHDRDGNMQSHVCSPDKVVTIQMPDTTAIAYPGDHILLRNGIFTVIPQNKICPACRREM